MIDTQIIVEARRKSRVKAHLANFSVVLNNYTRSTENRNFLKGIQQLVDTLSPLVGALPELPSLPQPATEVTPPGVPPTRAPTVQPQFAPAAMPPQPETTAITPPRRPEVLPVATPQTPSGVLLYKAQTDSGSMYDIYQRENKLFTLFEGSEYEVISEIKVGNILIGKSPKGMVYSTSIRGLLELRPISVGPQAVPTVAVAPGAAGTAAPQAKPVAVDEQARLLGTFDKINQYKTAIDAQIRTINEKLDEQKRQIDNLDYLRNLALKAPKSMAVGDKWMKQTRAFILEYNIIDNLPSSNRNYAEALVNLINQIPTEIEKIKNVLPGISDQLGKVLANINSQRGSLDQNLGKIKELSAQIEAVNAKIRGLLAQFLNYTSTGSPKTLAEIPGLAGNINVALNQVLELKKSETQSLSYIYADIYAHSVSRQLEGLQIVERAVKSQLGSLSSPSQPAIPSAQNIPAGKKAAAQLAATPTAASTPSATPTPSRWKYALTMQDGEVYRIYEYGDKEYLQYQGDKEVPKGTYEVAGYVRRGFFRAGLHHEPKVGDSVNIRFRFGLKELTINGKPLKIAKVTVIRQ